MASLFVIISLIFISHYKVEGIREKVVVANHQINTTLSIMTANGQTYDCIDFYKQPTLRNPLFKNLISFKALESKSLARAHTRKAPFGIRLKDGGCPFGTVPILRTKIQTENDPYDLFSPKIITPQGHPNDPFHCQALVRTNNRNLKYLGVSGEVAVYNPLTYAPHQWSGARFRLSNGADAIEVGWMVHPSLYNDNKTHIYRIFGGKGCFNLLCSGFVQVGKEAILGEISEPVSQRGGDNYQQKFSIDKHKDDGNWWVSIGEDKYEIGYWPKTLFSSLTEYANQVEWGGEVYFPTGPSLDPSPPDMGSGYKPWYDSGKANYVYHAEMVDENYHSAPPPKGTVKEQTCEVLYTVHDFGFKDTFGRAIIFGGFHED